MNANNDQDQVPKRNAVITRINKLIKIGKEYNNWFRAIGLTIIVSLLVSSTALIIFSQWQYSAMPLGLLIIYLSVIIKIVKRPWRRVIEIMGGKGAIVWRPGINFMWIPISLFMKRKEKELYCAGKKLELRIGEENGLGSTAKVDFTDASVPVIAQIILRVGIHDNDNEIDKDCLIATYEVDDFEEAAIIRTEKELRTYLSTMSVDKALTEDGRNDAAKKTFDTVNEAILQWGVKLDNPEGQVSIVDFILSDEIRKERRKLLEVEKNTAVKIKLAKAIKKETILIKQGEAEGITIVEEAKGEGEVKKIGKFADAFKIPSREAMEYFLKRDMIKSIEGSTLIATSEGGNLNVPSHLARGLGIWEGFKKRKGNEKDTVKDNKDTGKGNKQIKGNKEDTTKDNKDTGKGDKK